MNERVYSDVFLLVGFQQSWITFKATINNFIDLTPLWQGLPISKIIGNKITFNQISLHLGLTYQSKTFQHWAEN